MADKSSYGNSSITSLKDEEQVRQRPSVIFGTNDEKGAAHGVYEIIANSIDEAREGHGTKIKVSISKSGIVEVEDNGRGVPMGWNEKEAKYNWELVFRTLYASGKYDNNAYGEALGLNGLGATATQYASEFMDVFSTYGGKTYVMNFKKGKPVGELKVVDAIRSGTGTKITFKPDSDVFIGIKDKVMPAEYFIDLFRRQAMLHAGLEFEFKHEGLDGSLTDMNIKYPSGIKGFVDMIVADSKPMISETIICNGTENGTDDAIRFPEKYKLEMRYAINFSRETSFVEIYHNGSHLYEGGVTVDAVKQALTDAFTEFMREKGKINKSDKVSFKDIESILVFIGDTNCPGNRTFFKNQTKAAINNPFIGQKYGEFIYYHMSNWLLDSADSERVVAEVLANKTAREEADKVSKRVVKSLSQAVSGMGNKPKKFVDCKTKKTEERELFIVEGDSALGSCKLSRDSDFQAIMPVRGKILNCLKADLARILSSDIIIDLLRVLGCGIEAQSKHIKDLPKFNMDKLNYGKIIICTDADLDGQQIRCLIITMIYRLCPTLLKNNKVYIAETPLFEIGTKKDTYFAYNEEEKEVILQDLADKGVSAKQIKVQRSKGLGENDPEMMSKSTMHPETRRLVPVEYPEDDSLVGAIFDALLGEDIESRRMMINEYFAYTRVDVD